MEADKRFRISGRAAADLDEIFEYTAEKFGYVQACRYRDSLRACFGTISANPGIGRAAKALGARVQRHEHQSDVILYKVIEGEVLILAVVHGRRSSRIRV